jgi:hypothetical protein
MVLPRLVQGNHPSAINSIRLAGFLGVDLRLNLPSTSEDPR